MSTTRTQRGTANLQLVSQEYPTVRITTRQLVLPRACNVFIAEVDLTTDLRIAVSPRSGTKEALRQTTQAFLESNKGILGVNTQFFTQNPSTDLNANIIGLSVSEAHAVSQFEVQPGPDADQSFAILPNAPAINIDPANHASIVTKNLATTPVVTYNQHLGYDSQTLYCAKQLIAQNVSLWNAFSGSAQIITNGVKTVPGYPPLVAAEGYSSSNSWYNELTSRTIIGINQTGDKLFFVVADSRGASLGLTVPELVDLVLIPRGCYNALNMDGGGSTGLVLRDSTTHETVYVNDPKDGEPRQIASSIAIIQAPKKLQLGKARIGYITSKVTTGKACLMIQTTRTQTGKAALLKPTTKTQDGHSRIKKTFLNVQTGLAALRRTTTKTIAGAGRVTIANNSRTQTGHSRISHPTRKIILGYALIVYHTTRNQTGVAHINVPTRHIQLGIARII